MRAGGARGTEVGNATVFPTSVEAAAFTIRSSVATLAPCMTLCHFLGLSLHMYAPHDWHRVVGKLRAEISSFYGPFWFLRGASAQSHSYKLAGREGRERGAVQLCSPSTGTVLDSSLCPGSRSARLWTIFWGRNLGPSSYTNGLTIKRFTHQFRGRSRVRSGAPVEVVDLARVGVCTAELVSLPWRAHRIHCSPVFNL